MKRLYGMAALFAAASAFGSPLITGGSMDLGDPGKPVPGWDMEIAKINYKDAVSNPEVLYCTETVPGKTGYALRTPAGNGIISFALRCGRFRIDRDAEVEVSFDCKFSPEEIGKISSHVDLRTLGDRGAKPMPDWDHPRYPVLPLYTGGRENCIAFLRQAAQAGYACSIEEAVSIGPTIGSHVGPGAFGVAYISA